MKVKPDKGKRWQRIVSVVLLVLGFILVPLSAVAIWTHNQLTNTDRYVETVSPLAENADIQQAVAAAVVNAIFTGDLEKRVAERAAEAGPALGGPIATRAKSYATDVTEKLLASEQFRTLWDAANRRAHNQLVALLTDDPGKAPGAVTIKDGKVTLDLAKVIKQVQGKLVDAGPHVPRRSERAAGVPHDHDHRHRGPRRGAARTCRSSTRSPGCSRCSASSRSSGRRSSCRRGAGGRRSAPRWSSSPRACSRSCSSRSGGRSTSTPR